MLNIIYTTVANAGDAKAIATHLISKKLAACIQVLPEITSYFHWQGSVSAESEIPLLIKVASEKCSVFVAELEKIHPYEIPAILIYECDANPSFMNWAQQQMDS